MDNQNNNKAPEPEKENKAGSNVPPLPLPDAPKRRVSDAKVFGLNFLIFIGYTLLCFFALKDIIADGMLLVCHLCACVILAGVYGRWAWGVAGLAVFLVGVSIC